MERSGSRGRRRAARLSHQSAGAPHGVHASAAGRRNLAECAPASPARGRRIPLCRRTSRCANCCPPCSHWYLGALDQGGYLLIAAADGDGELDRPAAERVRDPAGGLPRARATARCRSPASWSPARVGSWVGASVMYWASRLLGRPLLMRYGRYVLITPEKIEQAEAWSSHYGMVGVFISRLLPVIRHLIGIPAGVVRMQLLAGIRSPRCSARRCGAPCSCWVGVTAGQDAAAARGQRAPHLAVGRRPDAVPRRALLLLRPPAHAPLSRLR